MEAAGGSCLLGQLCRIKSFVLDSVADFPARSPERGEVRLCAVRKCSTAETSEPLLPPELNVLDQQNQKDNQTGSGLQELSKLSS